MQDSIPDVLARASIPAPRGLSHLGTARIDLQLRTTKEGRYRWFRTDGTATVVEGTSIDQALHVAQMIWHDVQVQQEQAKS